MIVRLSSSAVRGFLVLLALFLVVELCFSSIRNALAQHEAGLNTREGYERAARLAPDDARTWYLLGRYWQYNLDAPDVRRAISDYQKALSLDSHSADTWSDLATSYETAGDLSAARNAFLQAKRAYPLSPDVSWRYGNFLLRRGELDPAFAQLKYAVQSDPKRSPAAFALASRVQPDIQAVLNLVLPPSPDAYLNVISALSEQQQTDQALILWSRLKTFSPHFELRESYSLMEGLLKKLRVSDAQRVWNDALGFAGVSRPLDFPASLVWDGGFESDVQDGGFAWRYPPFPGAVQIAFDSKEKHSGSRSLRLTFNGLQNVDLHDVCQYIAVQPSTSYRFSAWIRTDSLSTDQGVRFAFNALGDSGNSLSWTDDVRGTQPWTQLSLPWTAKRDARLLQLCIARIQSTKFDNKIHGLAWVDDVALIPQTAGNAAQ